jgi:16S rRNA U516 pseudouridylate synthase RsuA-like enzyme
MSERLQKYLAQAGIGSRRGCENLIKEGKVLVNGKIAKLGTKVSNEDLVEFDNKIIELKEVDIKLIALNKPEGVLSSTAREKKKFQSFMTTYLTLPIKEIGYQLVGSILIRQG